MKTNNFTILTDIDGKMPVLRPLNVPLGRRVLEKSHKFWTEYRNNKPTRCKPYPKQQRVYCYHRKEFLPLNSPEITIVK